MVRGAWVAVASGRGRAGPSGQPSWLAGGIPMKRSIRVALVPLLLLVALQLAIGASAGPAPQTQTYPIDTIVVVYMENRSFDHLFGGFPGANGRNALTPVPGGTPTPLPQTQLDGRPYTTFPQPTIPDKDPQKCVNDPRFPPSLYPSNAPWQIPSAFQGVNLPQVPEHRYYRNQYQIDGARNDQFVAWGQV